MVVNKDDSVLLSIIIPVFNRQKTFNRLMAELSHAISHHQLKQQLETQIEVIVIDDASSKPITLPDFPGKIIYKRNKKNQEQKGYSYLMENLFIFMIRMILFQTTG